MSARSRASFALALALWAVPQASAGPNLVPNPGFEAVCGAQTSACSWPDTVVSFGSGQRSTLVAHAGEASYRVRTTTGGISIRGECFTNVAPGRQYRFSYWYATIEDVRELYAITTFTVNADCSGGGGGGLFRDLPPIRDGSWHQVGGMMTSPPYTQAARVEIVVRCTLNPAGGCASGSAAGHFDDISLDDPSAPTATVLRRLSATRSKAGTRVTWQTSSERDLLGYNVYRERGGKRLKLTGSLIAGVFGGTARGCRYSYLDRAPVSGASYWLQAVKLDGSRVWLGSTPVR